MAGEEDVLAEPDACKGQQQNRYPPAGLSARPPLKALRRIVVERTFP